MNDSHKGGATSELARFAASTVYADLPEVVSRRMKDCFLDFIGNSAYASLRAESSKAFRDAVLELAGSGGQSVVVGESRRYPAPYAALLNGAYAHTLDFDDTSLFGAIHPGVVVIPAAMAQAELSNSSGREFVEALAVGYEVACRVGAAIGGTAYDRGFHNTSVAGIFGAVAAAGKLRGLPAKQIEVAMGFAGSMAAGSMQYLKNGAWNKRLHPGFAAQGALSALALSAAGAIAAEEPIEGKYGVLSGYSNAPEPKHLTDGLGDRWVASEIAIKPYPSCRLAHSSIDAALNLRNQFLGEDVSLDLRLHPKAVQIVGEGTPQKIHAASIVDGQFSVYFQVAAAWLDGSFTLDSYRRLGANDIDRLASRLTVHVDSQLSPGAAILSVAGYPDRYVKVDEPLGEPSRPLSWQEMLGKYTSLSEPIYGKERAGAISDRVSSLELMENMNSLAELLLVEESS